MIYKIRKWYGTAGDEADFASSIAFDVSQAMLGLENLRKKVIQVNEGMTQFIATMERFNTQVGSFEGLANLVTALEKITAKQAEAAASTEKEAKAGFDANALLAERTKTRLNEVTVLDKELQKKREYITVLTQEGTQLRVTTNAAGEGIVARERTVQATQAQINAQARLAEQSTRAQARLNTINQQIASGYVQNVKESTKFNTAMDRTQRIIQGTTTDGQKFQATLTYVGNTLQNVQGGLRPVNQSLADTKDRVKDLTLSWQSMARIIQSQLIYRSIGLLLRSMREAIGTAQEFSIRISELRTISQQNQLAVQEWAAGLRVLSDSFGIELLDQTEAAYQTLSNQVAKGAEVFGFLEEANRLALVGVSDATSSVQLLSAVMKSFNLSMEDTGDIAAQTFKTIELGRVRLDEMANTIGITAVPAANLGLSFNDLAAAITTVTIRGVPFEKAQTLIRNILLKLIRPTKEMSKFFKELGVDSGEAAIKTFGFGGVLQRLEERTQGSSTELGKLFGRIRAISGAMIFAGRGLETFEQNWKEIQNAQESYRTATKETMENVGRDIKIEVQKIKNYFTEEFGTVFLEVVQGVTEPLGGLSGIVKALAEGLTGLLAPAAIYAAASLGKLAIAHPVAAALLALGAATRILLDRMTKVTEEALAQQEEARERAIEQQKREYRDLLRVIDNFYTQEVQIARQAIATLQSENTKLIDEQVAIDKEITTNLRTAYREVVKELQKGIKDVDKVIKDSQKLIENSIKTINDLKRSIEQRTFEFRLGEIEDPAEQLNLLRQRFEQLQKQRTALFGRIDQESIRAVAELYKEQLGIVDQIAKIQDQVADKNERSEEKLVRLQRRRVEQETKIANLKKKISDKELDDQKKLLDAAKNAEQYTRITRSSRRGIIGIDTIDPNVIKAQRDIARGQREREASLAREVRKLKEYDEKIRELRKVEIDRTDILKLQNRLTLEQIRLVEEQKRLAEEQKKKAEEEAAERKRNLQEIKDGYLDITAISVKDILGTKDIDQQITNITGALVRIEDFRKSLREKANVLDINTRLRLEEQLLKRKDQLEKLQEAAITNLQLDNARKVVAEQQKIAEEAVKARQAYVDEEAVQIGSLKQALKAFGKDITTLRAGTRQQVISEKIDAFIRAPTIENLNKITKDLIAINEQVVFGMTKDLTPNIKLFTDTATTIIAAEEKQTATIKGLEEARDKAQKSFEDAQKQLEGLIPEQQKRDQERNDILKRNEAVFKNMITELQGIRSDIKARGGFQHGGFVGTDRVPAMLSPGEFVMNAGATRKFYSQLVAMNAGVQSFQRGGIVNNVGDVNVNMQSSGNESYDVTKFGKLLRRQIRRGTLKLR